MSDPLDLAPETTALLKQTSTATLSLLLFKRGLIRAAINGVAALNPNAARVVGPAYTLRYIPMREDLCTPGHVGRDNPYRRAIETTPAGHVIVVDARGNLGSGTMGDILIARLIHRGVAGVVTDGAMRDCGEISRMDLPVFCAGAAAGPSFNRIMAADAQVPIGCGDVAVFPGDAVVGDADGVVVVPRHLVDEIAREGAEQERLERFVRERVDAGAAIPGTYPPDEATRAAYKAWRDAGN